MNYITIESEVFQNMMDKLDAVHQELRRLQDPKKELSREWIDTSEVLQILNISRRTLTKYLGEGRLKYKKIDAKNFFKLRDVEAFLLDGYGVHSRIEEQGE